MARKLWLLARIVLVISFLLFLRSLHLLTLNERTELSSHQNELSSSSTTREKMGELTPIQNSENYVEEIVIAVVVCGDRVNETLIMIKSADLFSRSPIKIIIFADENALVSLKHSVSHLNHNKKDSLVSSSTNIPYYYGRAKIHLRPITFPTDKAEEWKKLFKPCASQRLFLPSLLEDVDSLLYMDTDTLFLTSPEKVWEHFKKMDNLQMAAVAPEHEDFSTGWYNRFARHPFYGNLGVNSGVMLMNLTRMRQFGWEKYVVPIYLEYKTKITWGDQDIINIFFHFHPEKLYVYPCHYNYRPDHCMYMSVCKPAEENGVYVLHGNRGSFHTDKQPAFKAIYSSIKQFDTESTLANLLANIKENLKFTMDTNCGKMADSLIKALEIHVSAISLI